MLRRTARSLSVALLFAAASAFAAPDAPEAASDTPSSGEAMLQMLLAQGQLLSPARIAGEVQSNPIVQDVNARASALVASAMDFIGVRYRRGGTSAENGFDCSGFTRYVFEHTVGLVLPHRAAEQARDSGMQGVARTDLEPGDLVFFNTMRRAFSHVGIYIGDGKFIHSPRPGATVRIDDIHQSYWAQHFDGARRPDLPAIKADASN